MRGTGTGRYAAHLLSRLIELDRHNEYVLYFRQRDVGENPLLHVSAPHVRVRVTDTPSTLARLHFNLPVWLRRDRVELYHSLGFFLPGFWFGKAIVTIHDIHPVLFPKYWNKPGTRISHFALRAHIPLALKRAARILTLSEYTRSTICQRFGIPASRIVVTPAAADPFFFASPPAEEIETMRRRFGSGEFFLYVGSLSPLKNVMGLVEAFARLRQHTTGRPIRLVLVGKPAGAYWNCPSPADPPPQPYRRVTLEVTSTSLLRALYRARSPDPSLVRRGFRAPVLGPWPVEPRW